MKQVGDSVTRRRNFFSFLYSPFRFFQQIFMHVSTMLQFINKYSINKTWFLGEVVVAQLVERSLPIPEVCNSNPVIGKIYIEHLFTCFLSFLTLKKLSADVLLASE